MKMGQRKPMISAFIIARNEEERIEKALKSLDFCDEIIFIDKQK